MSYIIWTLVVVVVGYMIYWIADWQSKHENGE